jgi:hypothetical protein
LAILTLHIYVCTVRKHDHYGHGFARKSPFLRRTSDHNSDPKPSSAASAVLRLPCRDAIKYSYSQIGTSTLFSALKIFQLNIPACQTLCCKNTGDVKACNTTGNQVRLDSKSNIVYSVKML